MSEQTKADLDWLYFFLIVQVGLFVCVWAVSLHQKAMEEMGENRELIQQLLLQKHHHGDQETDEE